MQLLEALKIIDETEMGKTCFPARFHNLEYVPADNDLQVDGNSVSELCRFCGLDNECEKALLRAACAVKESPALLIVAQWYYRAAFLGPEVCLQEPFITFKNFCGADAPAVRLLICSGYIRLMRKYHAQLGIPENITRATASSLRDLADKYFMQNNTYGCDPGTFAWQKNYTIPEKLYLRIGRFGFMIGKMGWAKTWVYHAKKNKKQLVFANSGLSFDAEGYVLGPQDVPPQKDFTSVLVFDGKNITGNLVRENGTTSKVLTTICREEYDLILSPDSWILDMHIPPGGGMHPELIEEAFEIAPEIFKKFLPAEKYPKAFVCGSWIFNPNLPEILPAVSNIVYLIKRCRLIPVASPQNCGLCFITLQKEFDLKTAPRNTTLERTVLGYVEHGGRWRCGGMFLLI